MAFTSPSAVWAFLNFSTARVPSGYAVNDRHGRKSGKGGKRCDGGGAVYRMGVAGKPAHHGGRSSCCQRDRFPLPVGNRCTASSFSLVSGWGEEVVSVIHKERSLTDIQYNSLPIYTPMGIPYATTGVCKHWLL